MRVVLTYEVKGTEWWADADPDSVECAVKEDPDVLNDIIYNGHYKLEVR